MTKADSFLGFSFLNGGIIDIELNINFRCTT